MVLCLSYYPGWHPSFGLADFLKKLVYVATARTALSALDFVIVPNDALRKLALHFGLRENEVIVAKRFLVSQQLMKPSKPEGILKREFHISSDSTILTFHGRLARLKGLDCLLRALVRLKDNGKFHLFLIGRGPDEVRLRNLAENLGISNLVHFTGSVSNAIIQKYLADTDVYVFPSLSEGHPKSLLEAMLMAKPIVASRVEGVTEFLKHRENALLFEPSRPDDLAAKVLEISGNRELAEQLSRNARLRAIEIAQDQASEFFECL
jgi:glycosyltransferase involved in cell wall biosynthesis